MNVNYNSKNNDKRFIERGDIFFFYRPKIDKKRVTKLDDVQRFYMITVPDNNKKKDNDYRLFMLGTKKMPEIIKGKTSADERNWALNLLTTSSKEEIDNEIFRPIEYQTKTRGKRRINSAQPVGEGKYCIIKHDGHTEFVYVLEIPETPGPIQAEFEINKEASYIISVKNPEISIPGYEIFKHDKKPRYPKYIIDKFGKKRWINIDDPRLLDYVNTQLLLIGARKDNVREELDIEIDEEKETKNSADIFKELNVKKDEIPLQSFFKGKFPKEEELASSHNIKKIPSGKAPGVKGGKKRREEIS
ncbi:MAG: hypothetical protein MRJ93_03510 [Nitrososphaeraceae archaeon]|nr:hypothetical protein [Nitrososphaeraceae archaeon]